MFHTQEKWAAVLTSPIKCLKENAWLGVAWYFWYDMEDAVFWGINSKRRTGYYEIYSASIDCTSILDTVFKEDHYLFWVKQIEKVQKLFVKKTGIAPTLKELNDYFLEKKVWVTCTGIMYQNIPPTGSNEIIKDFHYKKRIQLAVYDESIIRTFALNSDGQCV